MTDLAVLPPVDLIRAVIARCGPVREEFLSAEFRKERDGEFGAGWDLLSALFGYHFKPHDVTRPFHAMTIFGNRRSAIPDDLTAEELAALRRLWVEIDTPEFVARLGDVLWLRERDAKAAVRAVEAYVEAGRLSEDLEHWPICMERYERALRLARQLSQKALFTTILDHLQARILHYDGQESSYFSLKCLRLLAEFKHGDAPALASIAGRIAADARSAGDFRRAREYYSSQADFLGFAKDKAGAEVAREAIAEALIEEAADREAKEEWLAVRKLLEQAVDACRQRPALKPRIAELQKRLANAGRQALATMETFSHGIDISDMVRAAEAEFTGLQADDALLKFAVFVPLLDETVLREFVLKQMSGAFHAVIEADIFDAAGRKVARRPSIASDDEKERERAIRAFTEEEAQLLRGIAVQGSILPALRQIRTEHEITTAVVEKLLAGSALMPADRMPLFVKAFVAGANGDFATALHLAIPQVENGLRHVIELGGEMPRNISPEGVEDVWGMETCLNHPFVLKCLGGRLVFELRSLMVVRTGPNVRNQLAHGLIPPDAFNEATAVYLWWLLYRLAIITTPAMRAFRERLKSMEELEGSLE